jgi:hypothetical protein
LREESRLRVFESRVLRIIFGRKRDDVENYIMRSLMFCTAHQMLFVGYKIENNGMSGTCSAYGGEERRILGFGGET